MTSTLRASTTPSDPGAPMVHRPQPGPFRLRRRAHKIILTAHVLASVGWFGIAVAVVAGAVVATTAGDAGLSQALLRTIEVAPWLSIPVGSVSVASGVLLGLGTAFGLIRYWWVVAKIAIAAAVIVTDAFLVGEIAHRALLDNGSAVDGPIVAHVVVLALATVLSVFKSRKRTPWGRRGLDRTARAPGEILFATE